MSDFLQLPPESPAEPLMLALVHFGDMLAEHGELLPPEVVKSMFNHVCTVGLQLLLAHKRDAAETKLALLDATTDR